MLDVLIVDDEQNGREILEILLTKHCSNINIIDSVSTINDAIKSIIKNKPQLIFLDIELDNGTGFEILSHKDIQSLYFNVVFTTAYEQYAIEAIKNNALDYLLKPIDVNELKSAIAKSSNSKQTNIKNLVEDLKLSLKTSSKLKLVSRNGFRLVDIQSIIYCKSEVNYTRFYFDDGSTELTSKTLKTYQVDLEKNDFMRIHKSHIVNLNKIQEFIQSKIGQVIMSNKDVLDVSKNVKQFLIEKLDTI
jgi:two-component system LytT family response regulator